MFLNLNRLTQDLPPLHTRATGIFDTIKEKTRRVYDGLFRQTPPKLRTIPSEIPAESTGVAIPSSPTSPEAVPSKERRVDSPSDIGEKARVKIQSQGEKSGKKRERKRSRAQTASPSSTTENQKKGDSLAPHPLLAERASTKNEPRAIEGPSTDPMKTPEPHQGEREATPIDKEDVPLIEQVDPFFKIPQVAHHWVSVFSKALKEWEDIHRSSHLYLHHQRPRSLKDFYELKEELRTLIALHQENEGLAKLAEKDGEADFANELQSVNRELEDKLKERLQDLKKAFLDYLDPIPNHSKILVELRAQVGSTPETHAFLADMLKAYEKFATKHGLKARVLTFDGGPGGGLQHVTMSVEGPDAFYWFQHEGGSTVYKGFARGAGGKEGKSTNSVLCRVFPESEKPSVTFADSDFDIQQIRSSGPGGQNANKTSVAVRVTYRPTGEDIKVDSERSLALNKKIAMRILSARIQAARDEAHRQKVRAEQVRSLEEARQNRNRVYDPINGVVSDPETKVSIPYNNVFNGLGLDPFFYARENQRLIRALETAGEK